MLLGPERGCPLSLGKRRRPLERGQLLPRTLQLRLGHAHHSGVLDRSLEQGDAWVVKGGGIGDSGGGERATSRALKSRRSRARAKLGHCQAGRLSMLRYARAEA